MRVSPFHLQRPVNDKTRIVAHNIQLQLIGQNFINSVLTECKKETNNYERRMRLYEMGKKEMRASTSVMSTTC